jgi:hypothetical protein
MQGLPNNFGGGMYSGAMTMSGSGEKQAPLTFREWLLNIPYRCWAFIRRSFTFGAYYTRRSLWVFSVGKFSGYIDSIGPAG